MYDYFSSAGDTTITRTRALLELKRHGVIDADDIADFFRDCGSREEYNSQAVLIWLGY